MITEITEENYEDEIIFSEIPVVVDFWAKWCNPCMAFAPIFEKLSKKYEGKIKFLRCNIEKQKAIATFFNVKSIPTTLFFCNGEIKFRLVGNYNLKNFEEKLKKLLKECL